MSHAATKVLLVAEGPSEIGDLDQPPPLDRKGRLMRAQGYVPPMLRKLLDRPLDIHAQRVTSLGRFEQRRRLKGHADRAAKALSLASEFARILVFVKDVDRQPGKTKSEVERRKKLRAMQEEIEAGFAAVADAEHVLRVKATPCRMLEAWALGDRKALAKVAETRVTGAEVPSKPESLWGLEDDPASSHPKCVLRRVLGKRAYADVFGQLAEAANVDTLRESCPESFAPFAEEAARAAEVLQREGADGGAARPRSRHRTG